MYIPLITFFVALAGISIMIGRRLMLQSAGHHLEDKDEFMFEIPHPEKVKRITIKGAKKYGYLTLVTTMKIYIRSINMMKQMYGEIRSMKSRYTKEEIEEKERKVSKFLTMMGEYKEKLRDIKERIHEEEENR